MQQQDNDVAASQGDYTFGDGGAAKDTGLPQSEIKKMRLAGLLAGAFAKIGHRSIIYHRPRLRQRVREAFTKTAS